MINPDKKNTAKGCAIIASFVFILIFVVIIITGHNSSSNQPPASTYTGPEVVYEITGTALSVDITLSNATGGTEQYSGVPLSHSSKTPTTKYSYDYFPSSFLYVSAQNQGDFGTVTVSIYLNGNLYRTSTSKGAYVIATASGYK